MSTICCGQKQNKKPCTYRVAPPGKYCRYHKDQDPSRRINITTNRTTTITSNTTTNIVITNRPKPADPLPVIDKTFEGDCAICLCEIEEKDLSLLVCGHGYHKDCIQKVVKSGCPVCRGPLEFAQASIKVDIQEIKDREEKEKAEQIIRDIEADRQLARDMQRDASDEEPLPINDILGQILQESILTAQNEEDLILKILLAETGLQGRISEQDGINRALEETRFQEEFSDYEAMARALENSIMTVEAEEKEQLEKGISNSLDSNQEIWTWLDTEMFKGKNKVIITLRS